MKSVEAAKEGVSNLKSLLWKYRRGISLTISGLVLLGATALQLGKSKFLATDINKKYADLPAKIRTAIQPLLAESDTLNIGIAYSSSSPMSDALRIDTLLKYDITPNLILLTNGDAWTHFITNQLATTPLQILCYNDCLSTTEEAHVGMNAIGQALLQTNEIQDQVLLITNGISAGTGQDGDISDLAELYYGHNKNVHSLNLNIGKGKLGFTEWGKEQLKDLIPQKPGVVNFWDRWLVRFIKGEFEIQTPDKIHSIRSTIGMCNTAHKFGISPQILADFLAQHSCEHPQQSITHEERIKRYLKKYVSGSQLTVAEQELRRFLNQVIAYNP